MNILYLYIYIYKTFPAENKHVFSVFIYLQQIICTCCIPSLGWGKQIVFLTTVPLAPSTDSDRHKFSITIDTVDRVSSQRSFWWERRYSSEWVQASKVSKLDRRPQPSGKAIVLLCPKTASWARSGSENLPWPLIFSNLCLQNTFKLQKS